MSRNLAGWIVLLSIVFATASITTRAQDQKKHTITVRFNYDFKATPACSSSKGNQRCVQEFVLYDISVGETKRSRLMTIPVPANPKGLVKDITGTTPPLLFEPGKHFLAVVAQMPSGTESKPATAWVIVP